MSKAAKRQERVLALLKRGLPDKDIAHKLDMNLRTVQYDVERLRKKFGYASRRQFMKSRLVTTKKGT